MHQIKRGNRSEYCSIRPFSCYCSKCKNNDFKNCKNKAFTEGRFKEKKLEVKSFGNTEDDMSENEYEDNENDENDIENEENIGAADDVIEQSNQ